MLVSKNSLYSNKKETFPSENSFYKNYQKAKNFLCLILIIVKCFFSFCDIFFYTQLTLVFHLLEDFCITRSHTDTFCFFFLQKNFYIVHKLFFVVFFYLDNILLMGLYIYEKTLLKKINKKNYF